MAGILNHSLPTEATTFMVEEMCHILKHGGPDDEGIYACEEHPLVLGHRRLSLIDLSSCGHQPMSYANGRYVISFNGEIYNYLQLKNELRQAGSLFQTHSDTEVILAAFDAWGIDSFKRLNGMFAFAIWDNVDAKLYLVRDPSGIKPLYYAVTEEGVSFASEIRAFRPIPYLREENAVWPVYLMAYGHLPEPVSILKKVQPLTKGSFVCYDSRSRDFTKGYFKKYHFAEKYGNKEEVIVQIKDSLYQSVKRHLIADAPLGVFLSGGLDSSIIALLASRDKQSDLNTLSLYFEDHAFSEKKYQDMLLEQMACKRNQYLLKEEDFDENLPRILQAMDQPSCDGINTWFISRYAKENGLKAVLSGIGGDELYGGYPSFGRIGKANLLEKLPATLLKSGKFAALKSLKRLGYLSLGGAAGKYLFLRGQFIPHEIAQHLDVSEEQVWNILKEAPYCEDISQLSAGNQVSWIESNLFMQNQLLRDGDVMSMAHGIEIRVPFLDTEFIDLSMQIQSGIKYAGRPKQLLIDSFKDILPEPIWNRPKMGFSFPFKKWLANSEYVKDIVKPGSTDYRRFAKGNMHWSQFLSLMLIKNYRCANTSEAKVIHTSGQSFNKRSNIENHKVSAKKKKAKSVLFLTLRTFSSTGGIEKVSKVAGKALYEIGQETGGNLTIYSMYDGQQEVDKRYFPESIFTGFSINKLKFMVRCMRKGVKHDVVILSHVNLLLPGYLVKLLSPNTMIVLIAHGIEVWERLGDIKKFMLNQCEQVLAVSQYTAETLQHVNNVPAHKLQVLNNCLDPFLEPPLHEEKSEHFLNKYGFNNEDTILMTLTRLAARERYKGYDIVIQSLQMLRLTLPGLKYLIVGKYDEKEKQRLDTMIEKAGLNGQVTFAGFVPDEELAIHFNLADIYIMPSEKEGFGIVFIEAMYYNKPVIAGNKDGSVDALLNGRLGLLVNPQSLDEVTAAITDITSCKEKYLPDQQLLMDHFSYSTYKTKWKEILENI
ncbi:MAG: asparagine synthase (glutamine-hydrolyzing) [Ginsengibacter sp.]